MDLEANPGEMEALVEHQGVPKEEAAVETYQSFGGPIWGPVSNCRVPLMAEETNPG
jgi:hypothetical protein